MKTSQSTFIKIITSPSLVCFLIMCTMFSSRIVMASTLSHPRFFLSCRVIIGICQGDVSCLEEMSTRFPNCYLESLLDLKERDSDKLAELNFDGSKLIPDKRAPALKLMKVLMMKDRIPVGRR